MLQTIERILYGAPFGFPLGWIAARLTEGQYKLAFWDAIGVCVLVLPIMILNRWNWHRR